MAKKTLAGKTGSQIAVEKGAVGETAAQIAATLDAVIGSDTKETGGKENSLIKIKVPVFNGYYLYTYLPELGIEQLGINENIAQGVPNEWGLLAIKQKSETETSPRNKRPPGNSGAKRRVIGKKVIVPLTQSNEIEQTNVGQDNDIRTKRNVYFRFPSICPHAAIAIWLSKTIAANKMPGQIMIEKSRIIMPYPAEYTSLIVPDWVTKND